MRDRCLLIAPAGLSILPLRIWTQWTNGVPGGWQPDTRPRIIPAPLGVMHERGSINTSIRDNLSLPAASAFSPISIPHSPCHRSLSLGFFVSSNLIRSLRVRASTVTEDRTGADLTPIMHTLRRGLATCAFMSTLFSPCLARYICVTVQQTGRL